MKVLVFSDSHGNTANMADAVRREAPDRLLHLGDVVRDARALEAQFPGLPLSCVCGNCDGRSDVSAELLLELAGRKVLLCHGHTYGVKCGMGGAVAAARAAGADVLLFGHTHEPFCDLLGELWVMNPGAIGGICRRTYGVLRITEDGLVCYTEQL